jgi:putative nucleotidyltransferase with HDIG domain
LEESVRRILLVDEDPARLNKCQNALFEYRGHIQAAGALGGEAALRELREIPCDVVISNMRMRSMDGALLFERIKEEHPEAVRIMLCDPNDQNAVFVALPVSHQVLADPCDGQTLFNAIERACRLRALLTDSLLKQVGSIEKLPSIPAIYHQLMTAMANPNVSTKQITQIVERDTAMAAKLLQLVNSACFGLSRSVTSLDQAVVYLGLDLIRNLALTVHVFSSLEHTALRSGFSFESEQQHCLMTARVVRRLITKPAPARDAFTAALLHDIGKLVLAVCVPAKFKMVVQTCSVTCRPAYEVEAEILGVTHAEVGAYLLSLWGLPYPIVEAVAYHHNPAAAIERTFDIPSAVSVSEALVNEALGIKPSWDVKAHLSSLKVMDKLPRWTAIAREEIHVVNPALTLVER